MCDTSEVVAVAAHSCPCFLGIRIEELTNCLFCRSRRFPWAVYEVITDFILTIRARKTPPLRQLPTSYTSLQDGSALNPFTSYYIISTFSTHSRPHPVLSTLSSTKPSVSRRPSFYVQYFQSSTSTPTVFVIIHPPPKRLLPCVAT